MGVSRVSRIFIFALRSLQQEVLSEIQALGAVHLENAGEVLEGLSGEEGPLQVGETAAKLSSAESAISTLQASAEKVSLLERLRRERPRLSLEELEKRQRGSEADQIIEEVNGITEKQVTLGREQGTIRSHIEALAPWRGIDQSIDSVVSPTATTTGLFVTTAAANVEALDELGDEAACQVISQSRSTAYVLVVVWRNRTDETRQRLGDLGAEVVTVPLTERNPAQEIQTLGLRLDEIEVERELAASRLRQLAGKLDDVKLYRDHLSGRRLPCDVDSTVYATPQLGVVPAQKRVPSLDAIAVLRDDGAVVVACVWRRTDGPCELSVEVTGGQVSGGTAHRLLGDGPFASSARVESSPFRTSGGRFTVELPPVSATLFVLR